MATRSGRRGAADDRGRGERHGLTARDRLESVFGGLGDRSGGCLPAAGRGLDPPERGVLGIGIDQARERLVGEVGEPHRRPVRQAVAARHEQHPRLLVEGGRP
jgi:hypothetical protein